MADQDLRRDYAYKEKYGITLLDYDRMLIAQDGVCKICKRTPRKRRLAVDHNHKTKKIRGLLCYKCNFGLSWFYDNPVTLRAAAQYLEDAEVKNDATS